LCCHGQNRFSRYNKHHISLSQASLPVRVPSTSEGSSIGAALLAYKALGMFDSFDDATDLVSIIKTVDPQSENTLRYQACYDQFQALYRHLKPLFQKLRRQKET
jgi:sugar (pentulose or hexulose) kinase